MAASIAKWGATVSASWSTSQCTDDPAVRHAVHLPLTVGHPLWVILVDSDISAACPVWADSGNAGSLLMPSSQA
jgi:hypothetical protein